MELSGDKAFNPCPPGWQKHFDVFRDLHNYRRGWVRPDHPTRARVHTPEYTDSRNARLPHWGKTPSKDDCAAAKEAIHSYMQSNIEQGLVRDRADVLQALTGAGLEITGRARIISLSTAQKVRKNSASREKYMQNT